MAININHAKIDQIPDWTQTDVNKQIAANNLPAGTTPAKMVLSSDWNAGLVTSMATGNVIGRTAAGTGAFQEIPISSLSATPGGGENDIQINRSSAFYGDDNFQYDGNNFFFSGDMSQQNGGGSAIYRLQGVGDGFTFAVVQFTDFNGNIWEWDYNEDQTLGLHYAPGGSFGSIPTWTLMGDQSGDGTGRMGINVGAPNYELDVSGRSHVAGINYGDFFLADADNGQAYLGDITGNFGNHNYLQIDDNASITTINTSVLNLNGNSTTNVSNTLNIGSTTTVSNGNLIINSGRLSFSSASAASTVEGDVWTDSTQKTLTTFIDGAKQPLLGCLFTQTANASIVNTSTPTTLFSTGVGTKTLPANFLVAGKTIRLRISGVYSTQITPGNVTIAVKVGSTTIATATITNILGSASAAAFKSEIDITCRTTGSTGSVMCNGNIFYLATASALGLASLTNGGTTSTINTTTSQVLDIVFTWASASTSSIISCTNATIEILN